MAQTHTDASRKVWKRSFREFLGTFCGQKVPRRRNRGQRSRQTKKARLPERPPSPLTSPPSPLRRRNSASPSAARGEPLEFRSMNYTLSKIFRFHGRNRAPLLGTMPNSGRPRKPLLSSQSVCHGWRRHAKTGMIEGGLEAVWFQRPFGSFWGGPKGIPPPEPWTAQSTDKKATPHHLRQSHRILCKQKSQSTIGSKHSFRQNSLLPRTHFP